MGGGGGGRERERGRGKMEVGGRGIKKKGGGVNTCGQYCGQQEPADRVLGNERHRCLRGSGSGASYAGS